MRRMKTGLWVVIAVLVGSTLGPPAADAQKKTLVVALNQDPDILDPTLSRTYVGGSSSPRCARSSTRSTRASDPAPARRRAAGDHRRRQDRHHQAAPGRQVQRRHGR